MDAEQPQPVPAPKLPGLPVFRQPLDPRVLATVVSSYEGETLQVPECDVSVYHGQGRIVFKSGFSYMGAFQLGRMHGQGRMQWDSGVVYEGDFVHNEMQGRGQCLWPNGSSYVGDIVRGKRNGHGVFRTGNRGVASLAVTDSSASLTIDEDSGDAAEHGGGGGPREAALEPLLFTYNADLASDGEPLDAQSNARYEGMWVNGLPHGHGELIYDEVANIRYEGKFLCGKRHGRGQMHYASGSVYQGDWVDDQKCGHGVMTWMQKANSDNNQSPRGQQTEQLVPREQYDGEWLNDCQHGHGRHLWWSSSNKKQREKNWYEGAFAKGVRHGFGVFYYVNGARYEGAWEDNVKQGNGIFFYDDGRVLVSRFEHDRAVSPLSASPMASPVKDESTGGGSVATLKEAAAPVTAGARLVLYIDELLPESDATREHARKAIEHAAMRLNTELRALYRQYAKESVNPSGSTGLLAGAEPASAVLVMELFECRRLLADCGVVDISGKQLETFLQHIRSAQRESAMVQAAMAGHLTEELREMLLSNPCSRSLVCSSNSEIVPYDQLILYREFVELLVRVVVWRQTLLTAMEEDESERPLIPMGSIAESLSAMIELMMQTRRELLQLKEPLIPSLYTQLYARDLRLLLRKHDAVLRNRFVECSPMPLKSEEDPSTEPVDSISVRALLAMLRSSGCVFTPEFRVRDALSALQRTPLPAQPYDPVSTVSVGEFDPSAFDMTLVYSDFQEAIATILYAKQLSMKTADNASAAPSLCALVDQFIASQTALR